ncbi:uncharacterized protein LOC133519566 [Cydia pomonella]|uniref:uncharacterized protein LOC133519566 n=1 Tax=Cydia pomonella TaxID=82600 RepID=UPI002ADDE822|nr:uncharacterized protein LOC133519566 [Cydia pomonella]
MREFLRIVLVCACALLLTVCCEDSEELDSRSEKDEKGLPTGTRRTTTQSSINATRDQQLHAVLAARRRQLLNGRLATHINNLANIANKPHKSNTTFLQIEVRDSNSSIIKRITFDNSSNEAAPSLRLTTTDGIREIKQDLKPHEIRHLFVPKVYQENRSRAGFLNNRRNKIQGPSTENGIIYVPPEKLEGLDKEVDLEPDEEFQVDESNHGLYLLNYSDTDNVTQVPVLNETVTTNEVNVSSPVKIETTTSTSTVTSNVSTEAPNVHVHKKDEQIEDIIANSTDTKNTKPLKVENEKDKRNDTQFMSEEIYNHFRPLESELPVEDMTPFINFGQKIAGQIINDNLTDSPSLSASTKSVNFIVGAPERRKFNSRYSATEKYKNTSVDEEELNEEMDVSVVKNTIEKNKIRNTVKGPAPQRHVGLVNAYRKHTTPSTSKPPNIAQLNVTEPIIINVTPSSADKSSNATNSTVNKENINTNSTAKENVPSKTNGTLVPRNYTRSYYNLRRRPARVTTASSTENILPVVVVNTTTEKASTVYTAVVTSVSITSSMKGQNKTDIKDADNNTVIETIVSKENDTIPKVFLINVTETTPIPPPSSRVPYKHRIRIRTTTTESSIQSSPAVYMHRAYEDNDVTTKVSDLKNEATTSRISERLANLFRQNEYENNNNGSTIRPKNILRRRRPTTTTTSAPVSSIRPTFLTTISTTTELPTSPVTAAETLTATETTIKPLIVTSRTSSQSSYKPTVTPDTSTEKEENITSVDSVEDGKATSDNEVVIEPEKTYTASYVLAGLGFLPVAGIVVFVLRNILNKKTKEIDTEYEGYFDDDEVKKESPITPVARPPLPTPTKPDNKWEFPRNKLRLQTLLGQGNFGQVWKAEADDLNGHDGLTRLVAVKSIKESASQKEKQELLHEIYIMQKIGTHPNVVTLLACCTEHEPYLLIMEYVMCGKLLTYLRERRSRPDRFSGSGALTSRDLTVFAYCVARGMDYIASKGIVHRDLAARNVLVDHNKLCKIADFGMSRAAGGASRNRGALPVRWMAPEALLYNVYSHSTDVWAFGITLWEIVTLGSTPYAAMSGREVLAAVTEGYRLERPPHCKPQLYRAMHSCWHADPSQRPTFAALKAQLAELLDNEPSEGNYVDLDSFYQESSVYSDPSAIIHDDEGLSAEYDRERRCFRELTKGPTKYDNHGFNFRERNEDLLNKFGGTPRMGGFGIRDVPFNDRNFSDGEFNERTFTDKSFTDKNFTDKNFTDTNFTERKEKLSTSSFHKEREGRESNLVSRNSFSGFPRIGTRDGHFQMMPDGRNKRVSEFECDI